MAPVKINGQGPYRFLVDTGATRSAIAQRLVQLLQLPAGAPASLTLNGVTGTAAVPAVHVDSLEAGDLVLHNVQMPVLGFVLANAAACASV